MSSAVDSLSSSALALALDTCDSGFAVIDARGAVTQWNAWLQRATNVSLAQARGRPLPEVLGDTINPRLLQAVDSALERGLSSTLSPRLHRHPLPLYRSALDRERDQRMHQQISVSSVQLPDGARGCILNVSDVSASVNRETALKEQARQLKVLTEELQAAEQKVRHLAFHDALTGLPNRMLFNDRMQMAIEQARRQNELMGVILIDVDYFKRINDTLGHDIGDLLLTGVAARIHGVLRSTDTAARLGGDEFAVIQTGLKNTEGAAILARKLVDAIGKPFQLGVHDVRSGASVGVGIFPLDSIDGAGLIKAADLALYEVKRAGRGDWRFHSDEMRTRTEAQFILERELRAAVRKRDFILHFQPQFDLRTGAITSLETLVRWQNATRGLIFPNDFIPIAERTGLIVDIGDQVIDQICQMCVSWPSAIAMPCVAINLSTKQLHDARLPPKLEAAHRALLRRGGRLEVELTEGTVMDDVQGAVRVMQQLAADGISIAIDDFGTGYSSLAHLKRFPASKIKIDGSFVRELETDSEDAAITKAIIGLGHNLGHTVVAEGVETAKQARILAEQGCDSAQGYYFGRPLPLADTLRLPAFEQPVLRMANGA